MTWSRGVGSPSRCALTPSVPTIAIALLASACAPARTPRVDARDVAADVNGEPILWSKLEPNITRVLDEIESSCKLSLGKVDACGDRRRRERIADHEALEDAIDDELVRRETSSLGILPQDGRTLRERFREQVILPKVEVTEVDLRAAYRTLDDFWPEEVRVRVERCARVEFMFRCREKLLAFRYRWIVGLPPVCPDSVMRYRPPGESNVCARLPQEVEPDVWATIEAAGPGRVTLPFLTSRGYAIAQSVGGPRRPSSPDLDEYFRDAIVHEQLQRLERGRLRELRVKYSVRVAAPRR